MNRTAPAPAALLAAGLVAGVVAGLVALAGCRQPEDPGRYSRERPSADRLDKRDSGLQSYDVIASSDQMASQLLSDIRVTGQPEKLLVVFDRAENETVTYNQSLDLFLRQLRADVSRQGNSQIQIIQNRAKLRDLQSREVEQPVQDQFGGAGAGGLAPGPAGIQPQYSLSLEVRDLPNRGTNYYQFDYALTDLRDRTIAWEGIYDVRVAR